MEVKGHLEGYDIVYICTKLFIIVSFLFLQFLKANIFKFTVLGLLPEHQEASLFKFLDTIGLLLKEEQSLVQQSLEHELSEAMALMERDFPCVIQVLNYGLDLGKSVNLFCFSSQGLFDINLCNNTTSGQAKVISFFVSYIIEPEYTLEDIHIPKFTQC